MGWLLERWRQAYKRRICGPTIRATEAAISEARRAYMAGFTRS